MSTYIFILGKDLPLSSAELKARYPKVRIKAEMDDYLILEMEKRMDQKEFDQLGGSVKAGELIKKVCKSDLVSQLATFLTLNHQSGKLNYGISVYGFSEKNLRHLLLNLKKELKKRGVSSRFANQRFLNLSTAQHKGLRGKEIIVAKKGEEYFLAEVVAVQDIDAYSKRDYKKPFRNMQVGMLPPKLAQILINLTGSSGKIWDPFCGGGVLIMEGLLMGHPMLGSDIDKKTLDGAKRNIDWLQKEFKVQEKAMLFSHDATDKLHDQFFDAIAFEGYLGPPQDQLRSEAQLRSLLEELGGLYLRFFERLKQAKFKGVIVAALPFFKTKDKKEISLEKAVSQIGSMGFKMRLAPLKYARSDQIVGRMIYQFQLA